MMVRLCACVLLLWVSPTLAYFTFQQLIPNGNNVPHPCKANYMWQGVGHENPLGGGVRNVFGKDFNNIGGQSWTQRLCRMDSDGDGMTNGEELGDPDCVWVPGKGPTRTTDITHPGICDPFGQGICAGRNEFVECNEVEFEKCDTINQPEVRSIEARFPETDVPAVETTYLCMTFDVPSDQDYHLVANEALIDNRDVMHHIVVTGCTDEAKAINKPTECGMSSGQCFSIVSLWTVGLAGKCFGENLGFRFGKNGFKRIRLEFHYNNPKLVQGYKDASGMKFYYKPASPDTQDMLTFMIGQRLIEIPPVQPEVTIEGVCDGACTRSLFTKPAYITEVINHMHYMGTRMKVELYRNGQWIMDLSNDERYNYDSPVAYMHNPHVEILPGDELRTTCVYNSLSSNRWVYYGDATSAEMCFAFLFMYPTSSVPYTNFCTAVGPLSPCDMYAQKPIDNCDWGNFLNDTEPESVAFAEEMEKNCNLDGFCRPECKETVETIQDHPCLNGRAGKFVKHILQDDLEGIKFLGRLNSCLGDGHSTGHGPVRPEDCREHCDDVCKDHGSWEGEEDYSDAGVQPVFAGMVLAVCLMLAAIL